MGCEPTTIGATISCSPTCAISPCCAPMLYSITVRVRHVEEGGVLCALPFLEPGRWGPMWEGA